MSTETAPLLWLMSAQVARQCEEILTRARDAASAAREEARQHAAAEREAALAALRAELLQAETRAREKAEAEAKKLVLNTKDVIADELLRAVEKEIQRMADEPGFLRVLQSLLRELIDGAPDDAVVLAPPRHVDALREFLARLGRGSLEVSPLASLRDGVAMQDRGRTYRITNALTPRLTRHENAARRLAVERLFGLEH